MVLLPAPGGPVSPIRRARPVRGCSDASICSNPSRWFSTMLTTRAKAAGFAALKSSIRRSEDTRENSLLSAPHRRCRARLARRMIMPQNVQCAVDYQSQHLFPDRNTLPLRVVASDFRTNVDIADDHTTFLGSAKAKGDDVRRTLMPQITAIQLRHRHSPDKCDRQHGIPDPFRLEGGGGRLLHPRTGHREPPHAGGNVYRNPAW